MVVVVVCCCFFKQKTAYEMRISDWSSDVCSSDLQQPVPTAQRDQRTQPATRGEPAAEQHESDDKAKPGEGNRIDLFEGDLQRHRQRGPEPGSRDRKSVV